MRCMSQDSWVGWLYSYMLTCFRFLKSHSTHLTTRGNVWCKKKDLGTEGETSPQPVGEEEKREKGREDKERNRERVCNPAPLDPSVTSPYGPQ